MIRVSVDEGYAYDMLSIMQVKIAKHGRDIGNLDNAHRLERELVEQVGATRHTDVMASDEYTGLYHTNLQLFNHIDAMKARPSHPDDGMAVDRLNHQRFLSKRAVQTRFFPDSAVSERKIGYESVDRGGAGG